jgi:Lipocalin-like domain
MNRRTALRVSALALGSLPRSAFAQGTSLKEIVVGTWLISSTFDQYADGKNRNPWGEGMKGSFTFDNRGWFTQIFIGEKQLAMKSDDPRRADALALAFIGTYSVSEGDKVISVRNDRATNSIRDHAEQKWTVTAFSADAMTLVGATPRKDPQGTFFAHVELKRAKQART